MSSNLSVFDGSFLKHLGLDMFTSDGGADPLCFSDLDADPFFLLSDSPAEVFPENSDTGNQRYTLDESSNSFISSSPPSNQMENMSLRHVHPLSNGLILDNEFDKFSILEVTKGECEVGFDNSCNQPFYPRSYSGFENVAKYTGRSISYSDSLDNKPRFLFQPNFTSAVMDSCGSNNQSLSSPDQSLRAGQMRRVCSTGDLQNAKVFQVKQRSPTSSLATEVSLREDANFKVGRYTAEERKERISKYRAKRTHRNFNKTIKYACRKTLADTRPRIRGRFARNDENVETQKLSCVTGEDEEEHWLDGLHEEQEEQRVEGEEYMNHFGMTQFHNYGELQMKMPHDMFYA